MAKLIFYDKVEKNISNSNNKKIPKITITARRKIVDKVKKMSKDVHMEIFYFLKKKLCNDFTLNQNGVFINLNTLDNNTLYELREMVNFYSSNEKKLKESYLERYCNKNSENEGYISENTLETSLYSEENLDKEQGNPNENENSDSNVSDDDDDDYK